MAKKYSAPAVEKLLDIVELMAKENRGFSINEVARSLDIPVNSVYRICMEMEGRGYLDRSPDTGLYQLGSHFFHIGQTVGSRINLRNKALPIMSDLRNRTGETAHLCIKQKNWMVLLEQVETEQHIKIHVEPGTLMYLHASAFGKCLLAFSQETEIGSIIDNKLLSLTRHTIKTKEDFVQEIDKIRNNGWAFDMEEYMEGVHCVGAPIFGSEGKCVAALGIMGPAYRISKGKMNDMVPVVMKAANSLSLGMGFSNQEICIQKRD